MNLETLKKYWNELEHYKNGGSLLARIWITDDNDGDKSYTIWYKVGCECWDINKVYNYTLDYHKVQIIINDEYSIYRKALAEGKAIEYLGQFSNVWHEVPEPDFNLHPTCYRIKPDEPKFKVGDFVKFTDISNKHPQQIIKIEDEVAYTEFNKCLLTQLILWTPVKGEWCWFYDSKFSKSTVISQFKEKCDDGFVTNTDTTWNFCEPFLNSIPSYFKDK